MDVNPPVYRGVVRDLNINPLTPLERYHAYAGLRDLRIDIAPDVSALVAEARRGIVERLGLMEAMLGAWF